MFKSLLIPLDGSELAEHVLPLASSIAAQAGAELTLLRVVHHPLEPYLPEGESAWMESQLERLQGEATAYLEEVAQRLAPASSGAAGPHRVRRHVATGHPGSMIADYARSIEADLVVMATHGRSGLGRWALGSVADQVLQLITVPAIMVHVAGDAAPRFDALPTLHRVMVTLDGSTTAESVLPVAVALARLFESEILLTRVVGYPITLTGSGEAASDWPAILARKEAFAHEYLRRVEARLQAEEVRVRSLVRVGDPGETILEVAEEEQVDLIAMTTHGHSAIYRLVYGTTFDRVMRGSSRPVLAVRSFARAGI
jgi:nucleotide-binding universal stress UspA family protein